jgi:trigger factor
VDYAGRLDGEPLEDATRSDAMVILGHKRLMPEFERRLEGAMPGQELDFDVPYPEDYPIEGVAGRTVNFHASVKRVEEERLPEVDMEFAKAFGVEDGDLEELRRRVRLNMEREAGERLSAINKARLMDALLAAHPMEVPNIMVEHEVARMQQHQTGSRPSSSDVDLAAQARRRVALGLIIREIVAANNINLDPGRVQRKMESVASTFDDPEAVMRMYRSDKDLMRELEGAALEDQVVDWVSARAQVTEIRTSFDELTGAAA